jgi:hypothetical protein
MERVFLSKNFGSLMCSAGCVVCVGDLVDGKLTCGNNVVGEC